MENTESIKIPVELTNALRELKKRDGRFIIWHLKRAIQNYLRAKKFEA